MNRRIFFAVSAAVVLGVVAGIALASRSSPEHESTGVPQSLSSEIAGSDLLVRGANVEALAAAEFDFGVVDSWAIDVIEVIHTGQVAATQWQEPEVEYVIPAVTPGENLVVGAMRASDDTQAHQFDEVGSNVVVGATYFPPHRRNWDESGWFVSFVATVGADGTVTFHHSASENLWRSQLTDLRDVYNSSMSDIDLLVAWIAEEDAIRQGAAGGPISTAFASLGSRDPWADWYNLPPEERPLDPELTPPDVLASLTTVNLLVDIETAPEPDERFFVVKADSGIVHSAVLTAGNHAVEVLTAPGDSWRVVATDNPVRGQDELLVNVSDANMDRRLRFHELAARHVRNRRASNDRSPRRDHRGSPPGDVGRG